MTAASEYTPRILLTLSEAAECLRIRPERLRKLATGGKIQHVRQGSTIMFMPRHIENYIEANTRGPKCLEEIQARNSGGSTRGAATTSFGPKMDEAASAQLALQIGERLKRRSPNLSSAKGGPATHVIPMKSL